MSITAMKTALEALEWAESLVNTSDKSCQEAAWAIEKAIPDLRTAIAEAEKQKQRTPLPDWDNTKTNQQQGLYSKFIVQRVDGSDAPGNKHHGCEYFVLDVDHDQHAPAALRAYAKACAETHPQLSADLAARWGAPAITEAEKQEPIPAGYQLVPVEPTERMGNCGFRAGAASSFAADRIYKAMLAAAPVQAQPAKPLTEKQMEDMRGEANCGYCIEKDDYYKAVRDTEAAHGIKEQPDVPERTFGNMSQPVTCSWTPMDSEDMPGTYDTACGRAWSFVDGGPVENDYHFCHGCGQLVEVKEHP